ncbi:MAG: NAD(P)/FAD-dependent oxidoreductase [Burkholderiales bacterium]
MTHSTNSGELHHIVIVGGGAGGLELATVLGDKLGRRKRAEITLIDGSPTHLWKPLLHSVAAGSRGLEDFDLDYLAQARWHHFRFRLGRMDTLDRARREIQTAPTLDENGEELIPRRTFRYDTLILAVGSTSHDFATPGVAEHAHMLDNQSQAEQFRRRLVRCVVRAATQTGVLRPEQLHVVIVGAGATGVELAAELHKTTRALVAYGLERIDPDRDVKLTLVEGAPRILPQLPERLSSATEKILDQLRVKIHTNERVVEVSESGVKTSSDKVIAAELVVWAAGIKAPDFLRDLEGLETNRINQLLVKQTLETTVDPNIFAFGDCACCPWPGHDECVPPRAQAAHQQASHLARQLRNRLDGKPLKPYRYRDFGSLVSLSDYTAVGNLMGFLAGSSVFIEGVVARLMYLSLYKMHQYALHGFTRVFFDTLARAITRRTEPQVKLH